MHQPLIIQESSINQSINQTPDTIKKSRLEFCEGQYIFQCPWCAGSIIVEPRDIACAIFRHAVYKHNAQPINPHLSKDHCESLLQTDAVYGCAKPFRIMDCCDEPGNKFAVECDYI